ncbi:hypothetical protein [Citrobacter farmeri]|uniref:hypothetical protein n=1 Tax=Citrobacter farmeri TaxID=67824 RepID=UPI001A267A5C|nr:hypothetical protein [Citrobacter farmeri]HAT3724419.1 hypothetical protein [Citrobacter koseri]
MENKIQGTEIWSVNYQARSILGNDETRWITTITGDIIACDDDGEERLAGRVKYYRIHANDAMDNGYRPEDILDLTSNTAHFLGTIFNSGGCFFRRKIQNLFDAEILNSDLLLVDRIEILPPFRGKNFFLQVINDGIRCIGGQVELIALKAFPLQFELPSEDEEYIRWQEKMANDLFCQDQKKALRRLTHYYQKMGFIKVSDTGVMVKPVAQFW